MMRLRKVSYPAHISYPQPHELEIKFSSNKKSYDVFSPRNNVIRHLKDDFQKKKKKKKNKKKQACAESSCCFEKSAVTQVDPCVGVEKHPARIRYAIKTCRSKYVLSMRRRYPCRPDPFWTHRILTDYEKLHCFDIRITCI